VLPYAPGSWGPDEIHDLIAPNRWRLPFERRWREAKVTVER
jgi:glucose-6-phosphate 1-dehydrogenase